MKKLFLLHIFLFTINSFSQEKAYDKISYKQLFDSIQNEKKNVFTLKNTVVAYNAKTDSLLTGTWDVQNPKPVGRIGDTIVIRKQLNFENVNFQNKQEYIRNKANPDGVRGLFGVFHQIRFTEKLTLNNVNGFIIYNSVFEKRIELLNEVGDINKIPEYDGFGYQSYFGNNIFKKGYIIAQRSNNEGVSYLFFEKNKVYTYEGANVSDIGNAHIRIKDHDYAYITKNHFYGDETTGIDLTDNNTVEFTDNIFTSILTGINIEGERQSLVFKNNDFLNYWSLQLNKFNASDLIDAKQFDETVLASKAFKNYIGNGTTNINDDYLNSTPADFKKKYAEKIRYKNAEAYAGQAALIGSIYKHYRDNFDMASANKMYILLKDSETKHLKFLYEANPGFDAFFQWKVNQFLKVFSNYGTKPSKAITFSMFVIIIFALIYLFFPNSWDKHGKNRIIDRYSFFFKYMNKKAGIHEVYLEDQQAELMSYDQFKNLITNSGESVPKFFSATALPMYKWAISGTKISANLLKRVDIMKGTWSELPHSKRVWKSILLIGAFLIAIIYDLFIKILNALMLSINTFTTLGFGEIPIKGLPRYLAIIQGFIGWFMLTIFSVSLISQLLN